MPPGGNWMGSTCQLIATLLAAPAGYGIIHEGTPLVPEGPGGVLIKKPSVDGGVWLKPAPVELTAAGVYNLQVGVLAQPSNQLAAVLTCQPAPCAALLLAGRQNLLGGFLMPPPPTNLP